MGIILGKVTVTDETVTKMVARRLMRVVKESPFVDLGLRKKNLPSLRISWVWLRLWRVLVVWLGLHTV